MSKKMFGPIILVGGILLALVGALWPIITLPSRAAQPMPSLADLLLRTSDVPNCGFGCEEIGRGPEEAKEAAESVGLPPDYQEALGIYFLVYTYPNFKGVTQALYRYESEEKAIAYYEQLLGTFPLILSRQFPIISQSGWSFRGVKGQVIEVQEDPAWTTYWFFGRQGKLLMMMGVLIVGSESEGQPFFTELLSIAAGRMAGPQ